MAWYIRAVPCVLLLATLAVPATARAQATTGNIFGTVTDESKAVLPGVAVVVRHVETGISRTLLTDANGRYRALNLPPGTFTVTAELSGFAKAVRDNLTVALDKNVIADFEMKVGALTESVTVSGEATRTQLSQTVVGGLVTTQQIAELPLNGRNFLQLATLEPGLAVSRSSGVNFTAGFNATEVAIGGARPELTGYLLEGTNIADMSDKAPSSISGAMLGVDTVQEFTVQTHGYSAEFGRAAGGIVSAVTKSGTNNVHGSAFEFNRNSKFDAANFFDVGGTPPPFKRNQYGGTVGGPIVKNKVFYFVSYEGLRQDLATTQLARVPNALAHQGILPDGKGGQLNVGVNALVKPYLDLLFPMPNGQDFGDGSAELRHAELSPTRENQIVAKIDWQLNQNDSALVRFSNDPSTNTATLPNPSFQDVVATKTQYFTGQETHLFSNNLLNVFRGSLNRTFRSDETDPTVNIPQNLYFTTDPKFGSITITSLNNLTTGATATSPVSYDQRIFEFGDTVTWNTGKHTVKFGGNAQRYHFDGFSYSRFGGNFVFRTLQEFLTLNRGGGAAANTFTGNMPGTDTQRFIRQSYFSFFVNDDYHPTGRLTLNLGLRYEFITTPYDINGKIAGLVSYNDLESGPLGVTPGTPLFKNPSLKDFAPRLGFSWTPSDNNRTVLKGGGGIFYQPLTTSFYRGTAFRIYPYFAGVSISRPTVFGPAIQNLLNQGTGLAVQKRSEFIDYNAAQTYMAQYYLDYQHELPGGLLADLGYVGSRGYNLPFYGDPNSVPAQQTPLGWQIVPGATLRYPDWGRVRTRINSAQSWYNGLIVKVNRQLKNNLMFQGSYTFSRSIDNFSGGLSGSSDFNGSNGSAQDWWCVPCEKGLSSFDIRHVFVFNGTYLLPFAQNATGMKGILGSGWQISAILNATSGVPFQPYIGFDWAGDKEPDGNAQRPSLAAGASNNPVTGSVAQWFDPTAFVLPLPGYYGNVGRNTIEGPGLLTLDGSIFKNTKIASKRTVQLRLEVFNILNRANFNPPDVTGGLFNPDGSRRAAPAQLTSTSTTARQIQLGVKVLF
jgi:Carboxypeptidase regulatory-like domain/TonB dependent receptor